MACKVLKHCPSQLFLELLYIITRHLLISCQIVVVDIRPGVVISADETSYRPIKLLSCAKIKEVYKLMFRRGNNTAPSQHCRAGSLPCSCSILPPVLCEGSVYLCTCVARNSCDVNCEPYVRM